MHFIKKKSSFTDNDIKKFLEENKDTLKVEYIDFNYAIINPKNLVGVDEFNQTFFDKIDQIEIDISNNLGFEEILSNTDIETINKTNFRYSDNKSDIEKKIFEVRNIEFDIIENQNDYILYKINKSEERTPDLNDPELKNEVLELVHQKEKFDFI